MKALFKRKHFRSLSEFVHRFNSVCAQLGHDEELRPLNVQLLPIDVPLIYKPLKIIVISLRNLNGINEYDEMLTKGYTENCILGVNRKVGINTQIQCILEFLVNTIHRNELPAQLASEDIAVNQVQDLQKETDTRAKEKAIRIINAFSTGHLEKTFRNLLLENKRAIKLNFRSTLFERDSSRLQRHELYKEMYERFDFIKEIVDNYVSLMTGRGFKFSFPDMESLYDPVLNLLDESSFRNQYDKYLNHLMRDVLVHGNGYWITQTFYKEVFMRLLEPWKIRIKKRGYEYDSDNGILTFSHEEVFHLTLEKWDKSGYGVSHLELLVPGYLAVKYFEQVKNQLESLPKVYLIEEETKRQRTIDIYQEIITKHVNEMKDLLVDPTERFMKYHKNLYFEQSKEN